MNSIIKQLLNSDEPSVRFKVKKNVLGVNSTSPELKWLRQEIKESARVKLLLSEKMKRAEFRFIPTQNGMALTGF